MGAFTNRLAKNISVRFLSMKSTNQDFVMKIKFNSENLDSFSGTSRPIAGLIFDDLGTEPIT